MHKTSCLVIYSDFEELPKLFLFKPDDENYTLALECDGLIVNLEEDGFTEEIVNFVCEMSDSKFTAFQIVTDDTFRLDAPVIVSNCGFAP